MAVALTKSEVRQRTRIIEKCLKEGFSPVGVRGGKGSAVTEAVIRLRAEGVKVTKGTLDNQVKTGVVSPDWSKYQPETVAVTKAGTVDLEGTKKLDFEQRIKNLRQSVDTSQTKQLEAERALERVLNFKSVLLTAPIPNWVLKPPSDHGRVIVPCTMWSDWQYGEVVDREDIGGINEYNRDIADARVQHLDAKITSMCFDHMKDPQYPGIVVNLGGDMISGGIHPELADTDDATPVEAVSRLYGVIRRALLNLADRFKRVFVVCVVGNHGRTTVKPRYKRPLAYSYEWLLYRFLAESFREDKRFVFYVSGEVDAYYKVFNHRYRLTHGDNLGVRGGDGIIGALGPITRGAIKVRNSEAPLGRDHDTLIMGHWHQYIPLRHLIVNGSLVGYSEYARLALRATPEPACQALWFTHPAYGVIWQNPIFVGEPRTVMTDEWVSWRTL